MAHVLCITTGLAGIFNASVEIARRLRDAGHTVELASTTPPVTPAPDSGAFRQFDPIDFDPARRPKSGSPFSILNAWLTRGTRIRAGLEAMGIDRLATAIDGTDADLVLCDAECVEHALATIRTGRALRLLNQWFEHQALPGLPPVNTLLMPTSPTGEIDAARTSLRASRRRAVWRGSVASGRTTRRDLLRAEARRVGLRDDEIVVDGWATPLAFRTLPTLKLTSDALDFPGARRPGSCAIGPVLRLDRPSADPESDDALGALLEDAARSGRRVLFASGTSMDGADLDFARRLADAVRPEPDWLLVLSLGRTGDPGALGEVPSNVRVFRWLNQPRVLDAADLVISHAGIHTIHETLHAGLPSLVCSGGRYDQHGAAARVGYHELGLLADRTTVPSDELRELIQRLLNDETIGSNVRAMRDRLCADAAAGLLEQEVANAVGTGSEGIEPPNLQTPPASIRSGQQRA